MVGAVKNRIAPAGTGEILQSGTNRLYAISPFFEISVFFTIASIGDGSNVFRSGYSVGGENEDRSYLSVATSVVDIFIDGDRSAAEIAARDSASRELRHSS